MKSPTILPSALSVALTLPMLAQTNYSTGQNNVDTAGNPALGAITRDPRASVLFNTAGTATATGTTLSNGIIGPWATIGTGTATRWATLDGSNNVVGFTSGTAAAAFGWPSGNNNTFNYDVAGVQTNLGVGRQANTARYTGAAGTQNWGNNNTTTITLNGLMNAGTGTLTFAEAGGTSNGQLAIGTNNGNELVLAAANANIDIRIPVINTGANVGSLLITGPNNVSLNSVGGASTFTGTTTVNSGRLILSGGSAIADAGAGVIVNSAGILEIASSETIGSLSGTSAASVVINGTNTLSTGANNTSTTFAGTISGATGNLAHIGTGTLTLSAANSYGGSTTIGFNQNAAVLRATASGALGSGNIVLDTVGNNSTARLDVEGGITLSNPILFTARNNTSTGIRNVSGNNTLSGNITLGTGGTNYTFESASGNLTVTGNLTPPGSGVRAVVLAGAGNGELSGNLNFTTGNVIGLSKTGAGTWTVSGSGHTYTGNTTISQGTLVVNGNISTSLVDLNGGTLQGSGVIGDLNATVGTVAPGNSIESLGAGDISLGAASIYAYELDSLSLNGDLLAGSGTLDIASGASLTLTELASGSLALGSKLTLISYNGAWNNGIFNYLGSPLADGDSFTLGSNLWQIDYNDLTGGSNFVLDQGGASSFVTLTVVPEPGIALLGGLGLLGLLRRRR